MHEFTFHYFLLTFISVCPQSIGIQYTVWTCHLEFLLVQRLLYSSLTHGQGSIYVHTFMTGPWTVETGRKLSETEVMMDGPMSCLI